MSILAALCWREHEAIIRKASWRRSSAHESHDPRGSSYHGSLRADAPSPLPNDCQPVLGWGFTRLQLGVRGVGAFETPSLSVIASQTLNLALLWFATPPGFTGWYCTGGAGVGGGFEGSRHSRSLSPPEFHKVAQRGFYQTGPCGRFRSKCSVLNKRDHSELRAAQDQMAVAILPPPPYPPTPLPPPSRAERRG